MRSTPTTHVTSTVVGDPPPCPPWCELDGHGWFINDGDAAAKTCELAVTIAGRDVILERFAAIERGHLRIYAPQIRMDGEALDLSDAAELANVLLFLAGKV
jgi:hypothetical protein